jgi:hypothetical protein
MEGQVRSCASPARYVHRENQALALALMNGHVSLNRGTGFHLHGVGSHAYSLIGDKAILNKETATTLSQEMKPFI